MFIANRTHQVSVGEIVCKPTACPGGGMSKEASVALAKKMSMGRLLVKMKAC